MVQNGVCSQNDDICGQNFKDEFESLDIRSIVLNFGVDVWQLKMVNKDMKVIYLKQ